jgi:hypothetical protein
VPLFDPDNANSAEAAALYHLADLIAECEAAQRLTEATGTAPEKKAATLAKIVIGPHEGPWDGDKFTREEMAVRFVEFQIWAPTEGGRTVVLSDSSFARADEGGDFMLAIRRYARQVELNDRSDLYLFFLDNVSALEAEMMVKAETRECPRLQAVTRQVGPAFGARGQAAAQGEYLHAAHSITWGDPIGND